MSDPIKLTDEVLERLRVKLTAAETTMYDGNEHIDGTELAESLLVLKAIRALRDAAQKVVGSAKAGVTLRDGKAQWDGSTRDVPGSLIDALAALLPDSEVKP